MAISEPMTIPKRTAKKVTIRVTFKPSVRYFHLFSDTKLSINLLFMSENQSDKNISSFTVKGRRLYCPPPKCLNQNYSAFIYLSMIP